MNKNIPEKLIKHKYNKDTKLDYGRYLVSRKDGKMHFEIFYGTGWSYNNDTINFYYLQKIS